MTTKSVTSLAVAAGCALAFAAVPAAQAQNYAASDTSVMSNAPQASRGDFNDRWAQANNAESREYMRLLQTNWNFRQARVRKECSPIGDPQLRENCIVSFDEYTPFLGSRGRMIAEAPTNRWYPPNPQARNEPASMQEGLTGSTGTTAPLGAGQDMTTAPYSTGYNPIPPGAEYHPYASGQPYGVTNYHQPGRTYSGQVTGFPPSGTPYRPGPRPAGPKSGP